MSVHKGFFKQSIHEFFHQDIDSCLQVSQVKQRIISNVNPDGGLNFTAALVIMCVIEMMAGFYKGKVFPKEKDVCEFLVKYFSNHEPLFKDKEFSRYFYRVFRHGLTHEWSPKASGVAMDFNSKAAIGIIKPDKEDLICLNVPAFFEITTKALEDYEKDLDNGLYVKEFNKRYDETITEDYKQMRILRERFKFLKDKASR